MDNTVFALTEKAQRTAGRYLAQTATDYEKNRVGTRKWNGEDCKVREFLNDLPKTKSILDIPCGTGRFFPFYAEKGYKVLALDISPAMVAQSEAKAGPNIRTDISSIFDITTCGISDVVVCIRFLNLIEAEDVKRAFAEMQRVGRRIIFTLRIRQKNPTGHYHSPHDISLIEECLNTGWRITRNEPVHEEDYRIIEVAQ